MTPTLFAYLYPSTLQKYLRAYPSDHTSWALITGATDGIGFGFAQELCSRGFNVILHGRNQVKLDSKLRELQEEFPKAAVRPVTANASSFMDADIIRLVEQVKDLPITVLINNVGGAGVLDANFKTFDTHSTKEIDELFSLNVTFPMKLTAAILPILKKSGPSLILNIGSQAYVGAPFMPVYGATKGAVHAWTRALAVEMDSYKFGVEVIEILVGSVQNQQNQTAKPTLLVPSSREMARSSLERVGCGQYSIAGYFPHYLQMLSMSLLPDSVVHWIFVKFLKPLAGKKERVW